LKIVAKKVVFENFLKNGVNRIGKKNYFEDMPSIPLNRHPTLQGFFYQKKLPQVLSAFFNKLGFFVG
jgi:hypothetical protein